MEKKRSIGVKILGIGILCLGIFATVVLAAAHIITAYKNIPYSTFLSNIDAGKDDCLALFLPPIAVDAIVLLFSIFVILAGVGIVRFREWGRKILMALIAIEITWSFGDSLFAKKLLKIGDIIEIIIVLGLLFYFTRPKVKEQFL